MKIKLEPLGTEKKLIALHDSQAGILYFQGIDKDGHYLVYSLERNGVVKPQSNARLEDYRKYNSLRKLHEGEVVELTL